MEKKLIGYNIKKGFDAETIARALGTTKTPSTDNYWMLHNSWAVDRAKSLNLLEIWFEPVYEETIEYASGDWIVIEEFGNLSSYNLRKNRAYKLTNAEKALFEFNDNGNPDGFGTHISKCITIHNGKIRKATHEEIKESLILEAKRRGLVKGVKFKHPEGYEINFTHDGYSYDTYDILYGNSGYGWLYKNNVWAEVVKNTLPILHGHEGEILENEVKYGCQRFSKEEIEDLAHSIGYFKITGSLKIKDWIISVEDILKIAKCIKNE